MATRTKNKRPASLPSHSITRRDYLASQAPEPPAWYRPVNADGLEGEAYYRELIGQWPWYWADAVLSRRSQGGRRITVDDAAYVDIIDDETEDDSD